MGILIKARSRFHIKKKHFQLQINYYVIAQFMAMMARQIFIGIYIHRHFNTSLSSIAIEALF